MYAFAAYGAERGEYSSVWTLFTGSLRAKILHWCLIGRAEDPWTNLASAIRNGDLSWLL